MSVPCVGYGIRYEYGIFRQTFEDGRQVEQPDNWLALGSPWEFPHPEAAQIVNFAGHTETYETDGVVKTRWIPDWSVQAIPYNYMVPGYQNGRVNTLRLWSRGRHRRVRSADLQLRRLRRGGPGADLRGEHLQGALSRGLHPSGQGAPAAAAVLLRLRLDPRLHRERAAGRLRPHQAAGPGDLPAQRHPPGDRRTRADAGAGGREGLRVGRRLGDHQAVLRLHLSHPAARGPGGVVGRPAGPAAPPPPGDHLPDQRRVPGRGPGAVR